MASRWHDKELIVWIVCTAAIMQVTPSPKKNIKISYEILRISGVIKLGILRSSFVGLWRLFLVVEV